MPEEKNVKPAVKAEKTTAAAKKPAAKKAAPKAAAKKPAAESKAAKAPKKAKAISLDDLTTAVWKKIEKKDVKKIPCAIAIQVNVYDVGTFYIAVNANPDFDKQVIQSDYYLADGIFEAGADEVKKIADGGYDFAAAAKAGAVKYRGDLTKGILIAELLK